MPACFCLFSASDTAKQNEGRRTSVFFFLSTPHLSASVHCDTPGAVLQVYFVCIRQNNSYLVCFFSAVPRLVQHTAARKTFRELSWAAKVIGLLGCMLYE